MKYSGRGEGDFESRQIVSRHASDFVDAIILIETAFSTLSAYNNLMPRISSLIQRTTVVLKKDNTMERI